MAHQPEGARESAVVQELTQADIDARELAHRVGDGFEVRLDWFPLGNTVQVEVNDWRTDETFIVHPSNDQALEAFHHPFAFREAA